MSHCECGEPATVLLTLLGSTSLDATQACCWPCTRMVLDDWVETDENWRDVSAWSVERMPEMRLSTTEASTVAKSGQSGC